jgi:tetratricopeptide (TPR) repeat protein
LSSGNKKKIPPQPRIQNSLALRTGRLWVFRFALFLSPLLLLCLVEIALRIGGYGYNPDFFARRKIGNEDFFVQNENFSLRFFPRQTARNPGPIRFPAHKAPGTFRIFILGESAAMGDPAPSFAPSRYLEMLLREKYPGTNFEVINLAFTAINSHVILPIARECATHEGDLWIVYMGNNEMVGPFGAATVFGRRAPSWRYVRLVTAVQRLCLGQWLVACGRRFTSHGAEPNAWGGMGMFVHNQVAPDSPSKETVYRSFLQNLHDIVSAGVNSGAKVLLNTVAVNLRDFPPLASIGGSQLSAADKAQFDQVYTNAMQSAAQREWANAEKQFAAAALLEPTSADLQFQWAKCSLQETHLANAREHFQSACDNDALPFRADTRINETIKAEEEKVRGENLIFCDAAAALASAAETGICGGETFFEHVHFDFDSRYRLGRAWAAKIESLLPRNTNGWASQNDCEQLLGLSDWNRAQAIHFIAERMDLPPLNGQANNAARKQALEERMNQLRGKMGAEHATAARKQFQKLLDRRPEDSLLHENFAVFLELTGDITGATGEWERFSELMPQDSLGYYQEGRLRIAQQRFAESESLLHMALGIRPSRTDAWIELGNALALQQKYTEALASYATALKQEPQNAQTLLRRGKVLSHMDRHAEAIESYRASIHLNPMDGLSHHELALELVAIGEAAAAGKEFGEAARLSPNLVAARFDYGTWLLKQNHLEEAQQEFEAVLRLEPGNVRAQQHVAGLRGRGR